VHNSSIIARGGILNKEERWVAHSLCFYFLSSPVVEMYFCSPILALGLKGDPATVLPPVRWCS